MQQPWKKNLILFLSTQTLSMFGSSLVQYAMSWFITLETQSGLMMTISILCGFLPTFFISPFAGVWADRHDRKKIIMISDGAIALATLGIAVAFYLGYRNLWLIFAVMAMRGIGQGIQGPAVSAMMPDIVPEEVLMKANATYSTIQSLMMLVSPILAGMLMGFAPMEWIFFIDVFTALIAIAILGLLLKIPRRVHADATAARGYFHDLALGIRYVARHRFLKQLFGFCCVFFLMVGPVVFLSPLQVTRLFGADPMYLMAIEIAFSVGMMLGGFGMMAWGGFRNRTHSMAVALFVFAVGTAALGVVPVFWFYLADMFIQGLSMPLFNTPFSVVLQEKIEPEYLGRVFGFMSMLSSIGMPVSMLIFGPMADVIDLSWIFLGTGGVMLLTTFFMIANKPLLEAGMPKLAEAK